ncbi:MAG: C2H2-type zinc finger protein, partial [Bacteroidaceae bacterium]|nr:C2H2-type zinc finger protein [Bacteroidaceae bacterium]
KGCTREFRSYSELMTHKKNDHEVHACKICGTWFNSKEGLTGHMKTKHRGR